MSFSAYDNSKEDYSYESSKAYLKSFVVEELDKTFEATVPDPTSPSISWKAVYPRIQYKYTQVIGIPFTNPKSYADTDRRPPTAFSALSLSSNIISFFRLPDTMGPDQPKYARLTATAYSAVSDWMLTKHACNTIGVGAWEVEVEMQAFSDYIYDAANAYRIAVPANSRAAGTI